MRNNRTVRKCPLSKVREGTELPIDQIADRLRDGAVWCVGAVFVAAIHFAECAVFYDYFYHTGVVCCAAIAGEKYLFIQSNCRTYGEHRKDESLHARQRE